MVEQGITTGWYLTHPLDALAVWRGGLGIPGAVIGGMIALYWFCKRNKFEFLAWADIAVPGLALGQAIGRWGNFVNQELYGAPTSLPWAVHIDPQYRLPGFESVEAYHPLFLYESLWSLSNLVVLLYLGRKYKDWLKPGDLMLSYLIIYPVGRFMLEFLRLDASYVGGINANQALMAVVALASAALLIWRHRKREDPSAPSEQSSSDETGA
jgi:phosphatidylglycerol:prolipoprotein diacylglycerol transferase